MSSWTQFIGFSTLAVLLVFMLVRYRGAFTIFRRGPAAGRPGPAIPDAGASASLVPVSPSDPSRMPRDAEPPAPEQPPRIYREIRRFGLDRLWLEIQLLGLVGMAVAFSSALAVASFFTTFTGLTNFTVGLAGLVPLLAAIGIQGTLYIASWHVANGSALHANSVRRRRAVRDDDGNLVEASWFKSSIRPFTGFFGYFFAQPFSVLLFLIPLVISVFFSFDALFDIVYTEQARLLTNRKVARSDISAVFSDILAEIRTDRATQAETLSKSVAWTKGFSPGLDKILAAAIDSKGIIEQAANEGRAKLEIELDAASKAVKAKQDEITTIEGKLRVSAPSGGLGPNPRADVDGRVSSATARIEDLERTIDDLRKQQGDLMARLAEEVKTGTVIDKKTGKRTRTGCGPNCRAIKVDLDAVNVNLAAREGELRATKKTLDDAKRELQSGATFKQRLQTDLDQKNRELVILRTTLAALQKTYNMTTNGSSSPNEDAAGGLVASVDRARTTFIGSGSRDAFKTMVDGCNKLVDLLKVNPITKKTIESASCDTSALSARVDALAVADAALETAAKICTVDEKFNDAQSVDPIVRRGRECLQAAGLPTTTTAPQRDVIDRVEQENSPNTSHFERTTSSLRRGDVLAWLALAIAFGIDFLVFITAVLGARVLASPLISSGLVASKAELEETDTSSYYDPIVYEGDPVDVVNQKIFLAMVTAESGEGNDKDAIVSVVDTARIPPEHLSRVFAFVNDAATSDPPRARTMPGRPGVFRIENSLVKHYKRSVAFYEKKRQKLRGDRRPATGSVPLVGKAELEEADVGSYYDPLVYDDDPVEVTNRKIFLAMVTPESGDEQTKEAIVCVIDSTRIPQNYVTRVLALVNDAALSDPPRGRPMPGRPDVYRIENSLVKHYKRSVALYERKRQKLHGIREPDTGTPVGLEQRRGGGGGARQTRGSFSNFDAGGGWGEPPEQASRAADGADKPARPRDAAPKIPSGWGVFHGDHPDTKSYS